MFNGFYSFKIGLYYFRRCVKISSNDDLRVNEQIRSRKVRLIDSDGEQVGIKSRSEALDIA
ncbi:MAG: translation initiation factor IF-3, partial [Halanaerobiales bacterium]